MEKATLSLIPDMNNLAPTEVIDLAQGSLRSIDNFTYSKSEEELLNLGDFKYRIEAFEGKNGKIDSSRATLAIIYINDDNRRLLLRPLTEQESMVRVDYSISGEETPEVERARRKMWQSGQYTKKVLASKRLNSTMAFRLSINKQEEKTCLKYGLEVDNSGADSFIPCKEVFRYRALKSEMGDAKLEMLRGLVEDSFEEWKNRLMKLDNEHLYFISRELRAMTLPDREQRIETPVTNLTVSSDVVDNVGSNIKLIRVTVPNLRTGTPNFQKRYPNDLKAA